PLSSPPRLNDDHPSRIHPVVPGQELPPYPPLHRRKLLWQRDRPPHQHVSEVPPKHLLIFPSPPPIEIVTCIQPSPPRPLRVAKHLERILSCVPSAEVRTKATVLVPRHGYAPPRCSNVCMRETFHSPMRS